MNNFEYSQHVISIVLLTIGILAITSLDNYCNNCSLIYLMGIFLFLLGAIYVIIINILIMIHNRDSIRNDSENEIFVEYSLFKKLESLKNTLFSVITGLTSYIIIIMVMNIRVIDEIIWWILGIDVFSLHDFLNTKHNLPLYSYNTISNLEIWTYILYFSLLIGVVMGVSSYTNKKINSSISKSRAFIKFVPKTYLDVEMGKPVSLATYIMNLSDSEIKITDFEIIFPEDLTVKYRNNEYQNSFKMENYIENNNELKIPPKSRRKLVFTLYCESDEVTIPSIVKDVILAKLSTEEVYVETQLEINLFR
uniref:Uncharacterized protein n=1 Tax=Methanococcus maripaludis (strain C6 / ATCC BAA-1332) TaxID=444158 RepID=A9A7Z2_METM6